MERANHLFDDRPYIKHKFLLPHVVEVNFAPVENPGHDDAFDDLEATIYQFPGRTTYPDTAA